MQSARQAGSFCGATSVQLPQNVIFATRFNGPRKFVGGNKSGKQGAKRCGRDSAGAAHRSEHHLSSALSPSEDSGLPRNACAQLAFWGRGAILGISATNSITSAVGGWTCKGGALKSGRFQWSSSRVSTRTKAGGSVAVCGRTKGGGRCIGFEVDRRNRRRCRFSRRIFERGE
jgi:hypothetical protein